MAKQDLNIGASPNDGTGDPLRDAMDKVNDNFGDLYTALGGNTPANIVTGGVIDYTGSNKITFLYTDLSDLPAAGSYHGMFAHVHNTGAAYYAHAGAWIQLADKSLVDALTINSLTDVDTATSAPTNGQVLSWNASGSKWEPAASAGGVALTDLSVTVGSAGTANLAYNSASGAFTYTPPDLSGYQLSSGLATVATTGAYTDLLSPPTIPSALTDLSISDGTNGQVLTTDGSGAFSFTTVSGGGATAWSSITDINNASGPFKIAIGRDAGAAGTLTVAIGYEAGKTGQGNSAVAVGSNAGETNQGQEAVAIGEEAGNTTQGNHAIATGYYAGRTTQGAESVAIGKSAGETTQANYAQAIGNSAGNSGQGQGAVALGSEAGKTTQGARSVAIGNYAGLTTQGSNSIAMGWEAGKTNQGNTATALGNSAGVTNQGESATAIGAGAGVTDQGQNALAIGVGAGTTNQAANSIVINAASGVLENTTASSLVIKPIRFASGTHAMEYNPTTGEVTYDTLGSSGYSNSDVDAHLNQSGPTSGHVLSWNGSDYAWVANSGGGGQSTFGLAGNTGTHTYDMVNETLTFLGTTGQINAGVAANNITLELDPNINSITSIAFEGATDDGFETTVSAVDPTQDNTIQLPDQSGTVALTTDILNQSQYAQTVTSNPADTTAAGNYVLSNTGSPSVHNSSTAWYYGDVVHDPGNPTTSVVLDVDNATLSGSVIGDITSAGTSTFNGTVDFANTSNVDFTGATVSGLSTSSSLDDVVANGDTTARAVTINNTLTVTDITSTGVGFATMTSASDIVLNPAGEVNVSTSKIVNVVDPTNDQEAATKKYVDDAIANSEPAFNVTAPNSGIYRYTAGSAGFPADADNPTIYLYRGLVYHFNINAAGHPFYINTVNGTGTSNAYNAGVTNNGTQSGVIRFEVPMDAPQTLYYNCQYHGAMNGTIVITP